MNEDEAFIRAIVDSPGDDTPRLVYADWLDDRDDSRGPYLRAEYEWAKPWRDGGRPEYNPVLRASAAGLDPLWVARVSRPPMGVCCEHVRFEASPRRVVEADLVAGEQELELSLPPEYRAFLLNYNGGRPVATPRVTREADAVGIEVGRPVEWFDPLEDVAAPAGHPLRRWSGVAPEHPRLRGCIPIGTTAAAEDAIYLACSGRRGGRVYVWHEYNTGDDDPDVVEMLSTTFSSLLARLNVRHA